MTYIKHYNIRYDGQDMIFEPEVDEPTSNVVFDCPLTVIFPVKLFDRFVEEVMNRMETIKKEKE